MFRDSGTQYAIAEDVSPACPPERLVAAGSHLLHPLRVPWVEPEDVAAIVVFLASEEARHVSSAVFDVTAGTSGTVTA